MTLSGALEILRATPATMRALLAGLSDPWVRVRDAGSWTPLQILGHLIHGEDTDWIPRATIILEHGPERPFQPFDREGFAAASEGKTAVALLDEFAVRRAASLAALEAMSLTDADLTRTGTHPELGAVTLGQLLATWAAHDLSHVSQVAEVMAKRYRETVGPWRRYLPIVDRPGEDSG